MFQWLRERAHIRRVAGVLYDAIVAQSRAEPFYRELGISDTLEGRFELIALHMYLVLNQLQAEGRAGRNVAQALIERFVTDMDDCMREIGIGDLAVPRHVKRTAAALYERADAYGEAARALEHGPALAAALNRHIYGEGCRDATGLASLADYVRVAMQVLAGQPSGLLLQGTLAFPNVRQASQ